MINEDLVKRDVKNGWGKRIEMMREKLDRSVEVLKELEIRNFDRKGLKERLVNRQKNKIMDITNWIEEIERRVEAI